MSFIFFDVPVPDQTTSIVAGVGLFFILVAAAYVMFRLLRKTVKMAFRMAMVVTVLFTFVVGGIAVYWFGTGTSSKPRRPQRVQPR